MGPRAAERESLAVIGVHQPEDPSICVDVSSNTAVHLDFADVWYYSLKVWPHWTEDGHPQPCTSALPADQADRGEPHSQWGP